MDPETPQKTIPKNKLPKFLTTVTPLSKSLALIIFVTFPFIGFYFGFNYRPVPIPETANTVPTITPTKSPIRCTKALCIHDGILTYTDSEGSSITLTVPDRNDVMYRRGEYYQAALSPNEKFIYLNADKDMASWIDVYDIDTKQTHTIRMGGLAMWLSDGRLLIIGSCGVGYNACGEIHISKNNKTPWNTELLYQYHFDDKSTAIKLDN